MAHIEANQRLIAANAAEQSNIYTEVQNKDDEMFAVTNDGREDENDEDEYLQDKYYAPFIPPLLRLSYYRPLPSLPPPFLTFSPLGPLPPLPSLNPLRFPHFPSYQSPYWSNPQPWYWGKR